LDVSLTKSQADARSSEVLIVATCCIDPDLAFGDFNGDGKTDVFRSGL
jgi:hypothetical protein